MFERFTVAARDVVKGAQYERAALGHRHIGTEHLLLAMLNEGSGAAYTVLRRSGLRHDRLREEVRRLASPMPLGEADAEALRTIGIDLDEVRARVEETFGEGALRPPQPERRGLFRRRRDPDPSQPGSGRFSPRAKKVLELALREALHLNHRTLGPEHILLGLLREGEGLGAKLLHDAGLSLDDVRAQVLAELRAA
jgi:ATP-dependent Clp protease ATP-binding subunit ClpA